MGFYDSYRTLMQCGKSSSEKTKDDIMQDIKDGFFDLPNTEVVYRNNDSSTLYDVVINSGTTSKDGNGYKILLSYPYDEVKFQIGDYIKWNYNNVETAWLLTSLDQQYLYDIKGKIYQCNRTLKVQTGETSVITGYDSLGRPIKTVTPTYYEVPCVYSEKTSTVSDSDLNNAINIPQGYILVAYQYDLSNEVKNGMKFRMNNLEYIVVTVDKSKIFNSIGYAELLAKEVLKNENA